MSESENRDRLFLVRQMRVKEFVERNYGERGGRAKLSKLLEIQQGYLTRVIDGQKNLGDLARDWEVRLKLEPGFFDRETSLADANVEAGPAIKGRLPLISWVKAGNWAEAVDNFQPGDAEEWIACPVAHGPRAYVLRVRGPSMFAPDADLSFPPGELIFIDPDREAHHRSLVIAKLPNENEVTFKQLIVEGEKRYLQALNPAWPNRIMELPDNAEICGVVIFAGRKV